MSKPKHVLMIFCDQMRYDAMGAMGNPYVQTPNLDALAADSVTTVTGVEYIDRGYQDLLEKLRSLGADITETI